MEREGGEVIPDWTAPAKEDMAPPAEKPAPTFDELKPQPAPAGTPAPAAPAPKPVVMDGARPVAVLGEGGPLPPGMSPAPQQSPEEAALLQQIDREINFELNVLNMCYGATRNLISRLKAGQPPDIAEFNQFTSEKRTPLELAEPQIALDVYRQVRESLRHAERARAPAAAPKDALSVIGEGLNDALVVLAGRKKT
jgi:hypothetical protein